MHLDRSALDALVASIGDDPEDLIDLLVTFLEDAPELVALLTRPLSDGDGRALLRAAHTLKSGARDFGAVRLAPLCERLERDLRAGAGPSEVADLVREVAQAWPPVAEVLSEEIRSLEARR